MHDHTKQYYFTHQYALNFFYWSLSKLIEISIFFKYFKIYITFDMVSSLGILTFQTDILPVSYLTNNFRVKIQIYTQTQVSSAVKHGTVYVF